MTTIMIQIEDASNIQKILDFVSRLKGHAKVLPENKNDEEGEKEIMEAIQQMDNKIFQEVSQDELYQLIHNS